MEGITCPELLEYSLRLLDATLDSGLVKNISEWEPEASPVPDATLDSRLTEGITNLEHSAPGVCLDSGPMERMLFLEPSEEPVLNSSLVARPSICVMEERSEWKPVINLVISYTLDSRLMEGNTYLERSALGVSLDGGLMEGASCLKPLDQSVLSSTLAARPVEGVTEKISDWKPVINLVQDITPDGRPMEGTAYPEHSALGASLDSGLRAGMSSIETVRQSVLHTCLKSSARPMLDPSIINHTDVDDDIDTDLPENPAPMMNSQTNHEQSWFKSSVADTLDRRPMEGISGRLLVSSPGLVLAPDSGYVKDPPHPSPLEQGALGVNRRSDNLDSSDEPQFGSDRRQSSLELEDAIDVRY